MHGSLNRHPGGAPRAIAALLALLVLAGGCSLLPGGGDTYQIVAYFPRAVSLYDASEVKVLGLPAGTVTDVEVDGDAVRVEMDIDDDIPLPANVEARIVPQSLVGARYVQLTPVWTVGQPTAEDGHVIPVEKTIIPVEPDEALGALNEFLESLDAEGLGELIDNSAEALAGQGDAINHALDEVSQLVTTFAEKDDELLTIVSNFDAFTATLAAREAELGVVLDLFAQATTVLANERQSVEALLAALAELSTSGLQLVDEHDEALRVDLGVLQEVTASVRANLDSLEQLLDAGPLLAEGLLDAYDPNLQSVRLRTSLCPLVGQILSAVLGTDAVLTFPVEGCAPGDGLPAQGVAGQSAGPATPVGLPARSPIDEIITLLAGPTVQGQAPPSTGERLIDGASSVGGFLRDAASATVGAG